MRTATVLFLTLCLPLPVAADGSWSLSLSGYAERNVVERASVDVVDSGLGLDSEVEDVLLTNSTSFGGRLTAWRVSADHVLPEIGFSVDFITYESELPSQTVQGDGTLSVVPVLVTLSFLSPITLTSHGGTVNFQARYPVGASPAFPEGRWYPYVGVGGEPSGPGRSGWETRIRI